MKLKYYLRGLGLGIIFTTIVLLISFQGRKSDISDEEIIQRAEKLGMVMEEEQGGLFPMKKEENDADTEDASDTSKAEDAANGSGADGTGSGNNTADDDQTGSGNGTAGDSQTGAENDTAEDGQNDDIGSGQDSVGVVTIKKGDVCQVVAEKLEQAGIIENSMDFQKYMDDRKLDSRIQAGEYHITIGTDYEQIIKMITK